jgi:hypothetical protein
VTHEEALCKAREASRALARLGLQSELDDDELEDVAQTLMFLEDK